MTGEMLEKQRAYLPQFKTRRLRAVPAIRAPKTVVRKAVPLDPALAIANRFGKLAKA
jgi:alpha-galactosidase